MIRQVFAADGVDISGLYNPATKLTGTSTIGELLSQNVLNLVFVIIGILFLINIVMAGWDYMLSTGDPKKISAASTRILNGVVGLILAVTAFLIVRIVAGVIGIDAP